MLFKYYKAKKSNKSKQQVGIQKKVRKQMMMMSKISKRLYKQLNQFHCIRVYLFSVSHLEQVSSEQTSQQYRQDEVKYIDKQDQILFQKTPGLLTINELSNNFKFNQQEVHDLGINLTPINYGDQNNGVVFIRHGYSYHNYLVDKYINSQGRINKQMRLLIKDKIFANSKEFLDSPLHPYGLMQCANKAPSIHEQNIGCVYVSPMHRTLQTCVELFKDHPNKNSIKFIVQPNLAEQLTKLSDIFDQKKFIDFLKQSYYENKISFNCRYFYQHQWQANSIDEKYLKMPFSLQEGEQEVSADEVQFTKIERQNADTNTIMNIMEHYKNQPLEKHSKFVKRVILTNRHIQKTSKIMQFNALQSKEKPKKIPSSESVLTKKTGLSIIVHLFSNLITETCSPKSLDILIDLLISRKQSLDK